ncbi:MAG: TolC family protein [FCB group bacterium]|jgi:cobalt-zinc-cadmium efflux system outer membrane protein|nr:TolC family protein [FCB group bacterium]
MGVLRVLPFLFPLMLACATADVSRAGTPPVPETPKASTPESAEPVDAEPEVPKEITLRQAAALALVQSPDLAAYTWEVRAAEARILQAGLRPNPELSLEIEDLRWNESASTRVEAFSIATDGLSYEREREGGLKPGLGTAETTISLSQVIELGGKRMHRVRLAETERDLVQWDYEAARIEVLSGVTRAFVELLGAQDRLRLQVELTAFAERVREVSAARVEAGQVSPLELTRAETELASMRIARDAAARVVEAARVRLAGAIGLREPNFDRAVGGMEDVATPPSFETLFAAVEKNPDLARWADEMDQRLAALELERARRVPDVTVAAGFRTAGLDTADSEAWSVGTDFNALSAGLRRSDTGLSRQRENSIVLGVSIPLPLRNRNQGAIREAEYLVEKAKAEREAAEVRVRSSLRAAYEDLQRAAETALRIRNEVMPGARSTFELTQEGYQQGKFGFLEVLDTQRTLFDVQRQYTDALIEYHAALTGVERLSGQPLSTLGGEPIEAEASSGENDEHP